MKWAKMQGPASKRSYVYDHWLPHRLSRDYEATESASARCSVKAFTGVGTGVVVDMNEDMFVVDLSSNATWQQRCSCAFPACHHKACEHMCCLQSAFGSGHAVSGSCMVTVSFRRIRYACVVLRVHFPCYYVCVCHRMASMKRIFLSPGC